MNTFRKSFSDGYVMDVSVIGQLKNVEIVVTKNGEHCYSCTVPMTEANARVEYIVNYITDKIELLDVENNLEHLGFSIVTDDYKHSVDIGKELGLTGDVVYGYLMELGYARWGTVNGVRYKYPTAKGKRLCTSTVMTARSGKDKGKQYSKTLYWSPKVVDIIRDSIK